MQNNNTNADKPPNQTTNGTARQAEFPGERTSEAAYQKLPLKFRPKAGRAQRDPIDYDSHPYPAMTPPSSPNRTPPLLKQSCA
jgi:hypothetical protein